MISVYIIMNGQTDIGASVNSIEESLIEKLRGVETVRSKRFEYLDQRPVNQDGYALGVARSWIYCDEQPI